MNCTLCNTDIQKSGKVRPNVATFECGHEFHLNCTIDYCKSRYTNLCPICDPIKYGSLVNLGTNRLDAIETLSKINTTF